MKDATGTNIGGQPFLWLEQWQTSPPCRRFGIYFNTNKLYKETICVSGTHGKTTTTSMLSYCFVNAQKDPSIEVGALLDFIGGNYRVGNSEYFILESCEYKGNFLKFFPHTEIILNIDNDHLDYFKSLYPNDEIFFICGTDNLIDFENWARPDYILENYKLLVVTRNNHDFEEIVKEKYYIYKDNIISANVKPRETSSTQIRSLIKSGVGREELLKYLDENVIDYIEENNLYK